MESEPPRTGILADPGGSQGGIYRDKGPRRLLPRENWGRCNPRSLGKCPTVREGSANLRGGGCGKTPAPDGRPGAPFRVPGLRPVGYRELRADHEGRSHRGRAGPHSPLPCSPPHTRLESGIPQGLPGAAASPMDLPGDSR